MKITIVTAYYNRRQLFINSLKTMSRSEHKDFEVLAINDCSTEEESIDDLQDEFDFLKVINISKEEKTWVNPCIPYNIGFSQVDSEVIIIQNPECMHFGDVISYVSDNIEENKYLSFSCYSINKAMTKVVSLCDTKEYLEELVTPFLEGFNGDGNNGWYNHISYRAVMYHFCSAITRTDLEKISGFDERFADGIGFDDNEILERIRRSSIEIVPVTLADQPPHPDNPLVIHQFHEASNYALGNGLIMRNQNLLQQIKGEEYIKPPINKFYRT